MRRSILAVLIGSIGVLAWPGAAFASVQTTLTLAGGHPTIAGTLPVQSFEWGTSQAGSGTGGYSGRNQDRSSSVSGGEFTVTMDTDKSLPKVLTSSAFTSATLSMTHVPGSSPYMQIVFDTVFVDTLSVDPSSADRGMPVVTVKFAYRSVTITYAAESNCSLASRSWESLSQVTPAVDPATGGAATDPLQEFLPVQLGDAGPGAVNVSDPSLADTLLQANGANGLSNLRAQTLATRLNVDSGALDPALVSSELSQADALLGANKPGTWSQLDPGTQSAINQLVGNFKATDVPASGCPLVPEAAALVPAQTFALSGLVTDACTGAPVKGLSASVSAVGAPGPISLPTNHSEFGIPTLSPDTYELTLNGPGYTPFTLPAVQIPAVQQPPLSGGFADGSEIAVAMAPAGGCAPGKPAVGPVDVPALSGGLFDECSLQALNGGTVNLVPPAGGTIPAVMHENDFSLAELSGGSYGLSEQAPGHQPILYTGGTLPAVQMPAQPSQLPDGSGARYGIIVVAEPAPAGAAC